MTNGKKLYAGFGLLLGGLLILFIVSVFAGWKESSARKDASSALDGVGTVEAVRYQIMLNRIPPVKLCAPLSSRSRAPKPVGPTTLPSRSSPSAIKWIQATLLFPTCKFFTCRKIPLLG